MGSEIFNRLFIKIPQQAAGCIQEWIYERHYAHLSSGFLQGAGNRRSWVGTGSKTGISDDIRERTGSEQATEGIEE